jgi:hypothetical protein
MPVNVILTSSVKISHRYRVQNSRHAKSRFSWTRHFLYSFINLNKKKELIKASVRSASLVHEKNTIENP